ncbi:MAG: ABC transporter ATP-binding protein [Candidatus Marinimicrobia bacterium]|nr:ABC transporter ATP-binding protein [Candidatus Neomarinimicrobiota bacterium]
MEASITLKNVSKKLKKRYIISNVSFGVEKGSIFGILGRNGSGKSTLLRLMSGMNVIDNGKIFIFGKEISNKKQKVRIGYLPQYDMHDPWMMVREVLFKRASLLGINKDESEERIIYFINELEIGDYLNECIMNCSVGIRRKIDLIQVLLGDPEILLLDEPTNNLDIVSLNSVLREFVRLKNKGATIVISTNNLSDFLSIFDRWIILSNGRVVFDGNWEKFESIDELPYRCEFRLKKVADESLSFDEVESGIMEKEERNGYWIVKFQSPAFFKKFVERVGIENMVLLDSDIIDFEILLRNIGKDDII